MNLVLTARALARPAIVGVAGAILDGHGRVLLVRHTYEPGWRLPGGGIGHGEALETALRRELAEELNFRGGEVRLFGLYARKVWWISHVVALYVIEGGTFDFRPSWEISAVVWEALDAPPPGTTPATLRRLAELAAGAQQQGHW
jgi:ADP-ribose pyrophosphatase YjhB (NUDIX family)